MLRSRAKALRNLALAVIVLAPFGLFFAANAGPQPLVIAVFALMAAAMALVVALK